AIAFAGDQHRLVIEQSLTVLAQRLWLVAGVMPEQAEFFEQLTIGADLQRIGLVLCWVTRRSVGGQILVGQGAAGQRPVAAEEPQLGGALGEEYGSIAAFAAGDHQGCGRSSAHARS